MIPNLEVGSSRPLRRVEYCQKDEPIYLPGKLVSRDPGPSWTRRSTTLCRRVGAPFRPCPVKVWNKGTCTVSHRTLGVPSGNESSSWYSPTTLEPKKRRRYRRKVSWGRTNVHEKDCHYSRCLEPPPSPCAQRSYRPYREGPRGLGPHSREPTLCDQRVEWVSVDGRGRVDPPRGNADSTR